MGLTRFEWDRVKDAANRAKHGVSFKVAQYAFVDPQRVIAEDASHSRSEKRYYCFGRVGEGVIGGWRDHANRFLSSEQLFSGLVHFDSFEFPDEQYLGNQGVTIKSRREKPGGGVTEAERHCQLRQERVRTLQSVRRTRVPPVADRRDAWRSAMRGGYERHDPSAGPCALEARRSPVGV